MGRARVVVDVCALDAVARQNRRSKLFVLFGYQFHRLVATRLLALADHCIRYQQIDAVWFTFDVFVDPGKLYFELFGRQAHRAEHAHTAGLGYLGNHVAAVTESDQREFDVQ